ncbi:aminotransferase class I/II-fold pyridoxal phosphate-dependent enzyme [Luteimonas sp. M1R5S18]|uniref:cysteine-S-conjugate beta-lyase n=1 Tax=Luteimonas rhizosphaericola TaxID=3042024 RepID=A0ABT6JKU0_9GAMM|nr:aminotransferase class I/II-fold pyridoxal phosphate-dependent enzyme [Luteimonas rhizosphaericola]MDH5831289.1 aminotransferase class I/II-fold pyridoxal phosphate-dependent enzyme [Luteimonas rhizosphaericola]
MSTPEHDYDRIDEAGLRGVGGLKWSAFPDCIGAFVAEMDFGLAEPVAAALHDAVSRGRSGYPTPALTRELARACADWQQSRYGWAVEPSRIHAVGDVLGGLEIVLEHFLPAGAPVVLPTPAYMPFRPLLELHGHPVIDVPHAWRDGRWEMDLDGIDAALGSGARLVLLCNPHNPLGRVFGYDELQALSAVVERHGARVFSDEIHAPLVYAGARHVPYASVSEAAGRHAVVAVSASKGWNLAGLKCAQLVFAADDLPRWRDMALVAGHGVSGLGMIATLAAWRDGGDWLDRVLEYLDGNRALVAEWMARHRPDAVFAPPQGTYLAWIDCRDLTLPSDTSAGAYFRRHARVALTDGLDCGAAGAGFVRLNFAMPRPLLRETLARMAHALDDLRNASPG